MKNILCLLAVVLTAFSQPAFAQCNAGEVEIQIEIHTDAYGYEGYWELIPVDSSCGQGTLLSGGNSAVGCTGAGTQQQPAGGYGNNDIITSASLCVTAGAEYKIAYADDWGDGGFEFFVFINGFLVESFSGAGAFEYYTFSASEPPAYNLTMLHPHLPVYAGPGDITIEAEVYNAGTKTINAVELFYSIDGQTSISAVISGLNIPHGESEHIEHPTAWTVNDHGTYEVQVFHGLVNDTASDADTTDNSVLAEVTIGPPQLNVIDSYLITLPVITEIADASNQVNLPTDLDFHPILSNKELWVLNKDSENTGSSTVIIKNAGEANQTSLWRRDGNAWHFMSMSTGIAMGANGNFGTSPGIYDANHNGGLPFTGPALWSSDLSIYAQPSGGNGSHLDMLHESPECQGIAWETGNAYWVFDGYNEDIVRYDFADDHGPGNDDHSDGEILRFSELSVKADPQEEVVSHLVYDHSDDWLYVVDHGNMRVFKMDTKSGSLGATPTFGPFEPLAEYRHVEDYDYEVIIDSGLIEPAGIDIIGKYLLVSDHFSGEVIIYDKSQQPVQELKRIQTGAEGLMGIKVGPAGKIWFVDHEDESVNRIDWVADSTVGMTEPVQDLEVYVYPNPANGPFWIDNRSGASVDVEIFNTVGSRVFTGRSSPGRQEIEPMLSSGLYIVKLRNTTSNSIKTSLLEIIK